jgi:chromosome segregation ATPase
MSTVDDAKDMISKLEGRLDAVEAKNASSSGAGNGVADQEALRVYQAKLLARLKEIRSTIGDGDAGAIKKERDDALAENARLQKELERAHYRINHILKELNKSEEEVASLQADSKTSAPKPPAAPSAAVTKAPEDQKKKKSFFSSMFG